MCMNSTKTIIINFITTLNTSLEPFHDYVTSNYLFELFESQRISLVEKERITLLSFVRTINKLANVSNLITRKTTYDCNGIILNTYYIDNTTSNLYDKKRTTLNNIVDLSICNLESPNANTGTTKNHTSKNISMGEVLQDNNNNQLRSHSTTPIITPRLQAFNSLHMSPDNWDGAADTVIQNFEYWTDFGQELILRDVPGNEIVVPIGIEKDGRLRVQSRNGGNERLLCADYLL